MADFDKQSYWEDRFQDETAFEWLVPASKFLSLLEPHLASLANSGRILHLGFGTSSLQNHLRARGWTDVTNVDFSPAAVKHGQQAEAAAFGEVRMRYVVADVTALDLGEETETQTFTLVIDKSTVDAVSCGEADALLRMARGIRRHLASGGVWISLSYSATRFDDAALRALFSVEVVGTVPIAKQHPNDPDLFYWCYLLRPRA